ncbi:Tripartite motif-containing protein 55 [Dissostichus eleginoides]|uniref:RING-type E3 ubiquitin transferase n=1 Tax=Dissostichus eleginoides TaxID=100907 RepID=A0AAD9ERT6_DISEL|nr:Tripartite motif-containing protein 55 [Dissostichus eleginoides]
MPRPFTCVMPRPLQASNPYLTTRSGSTVSSGGRFRCPSCRHEVVLDRHGVYGLQRNLLVENIIDMFNQGSARAAPGKQNIIDMLNQGSARAAPGKQNLIDMFNQGSARAAPGKQNLIDMFNQGSARPAPEQQLEPRCETHEEEKINIYCVSCSMPTCSLCKVFGPHRDCMVAPLEAVCTQQKESGRRQKSQVCEACDQLFALLEERKAMLTLRISCEQEEKLLYVRSLSRKYREHLENTASLLESSLRALDTKEMAQFLQTAKPLLQKMVEGSDTSHLDQVTPGYENMDHLTGSFEPQRRALMGVDFIKREKHLNVQSETRRLNLTLTAGDHWLV